MLFLCHVHESSNLNSRTGKKKPGMLFLCLVFLVFRGTVLCLVPGDSCFFAFSSRVGGWVPRVVDFAYISVFRYIWFVYIYRITIYGVGVIWGCIFIYCIKQGYFFIFYIIGRFKLQY